MAESAQELMESGKVSNATADGLVKNQISGNWEPYRGQPMQDPGGNYVKGASK